MMIQKQFSTYDKSSKTHSNFLVINTVSGQLSFFLDSSFPFKRVQKPFKSLLSLNLSLLERFKARKPPYLSVYSGMIHLKAQFPECTDLQPYLMFYELPCKNLAFFCQKQIDLKPALQQSYNQVSQHANTRENQIYCFFIKAIL